MENLNDSISRRTLLRGAGAALAVPFVTKVGELLATDNRPGKAAGPVVSVGAAADASRVAPGQAPYRGRWYGPTRYFGFHHDTHVMAGDRDIGAQADPEQLVPMLKLTGADFVQTDSKGHPGYTCWPSETPGASVGPGVVKDSVRGCARQPRGSVCHCIAIIRAFSTRRRGQDIFSGAASAPTASPSTTRSGEGAHPTATGCARGAATSMS